MELAKKFRELQIPAIKGEFELFTFFIRPGVIQPGFIKPIYHLPYGAVD